MKILIIGSKGFIGSHCVDYFKSKGDEVFEVNLEESFHKNSYTATNANSDFSRPFKEHQFDVCINASGSANVGFSFENPTKDFELNAINVQKILVAIRDYNQECKLINFSSAAVYGNPEELPVKENITSKPLSPYGFHKLQSELLLTEYHKFFGLKTCSLRVFSTYGPRLKKQLFWDILEKSRDSGVVTLFGTGDETRDFIYIDDLVRIIDLIIKKDTFEGTIFNVANNIEISISHAANLFMKSYSSDKRVLFNGKVKVGDPSNWLADISKIKQLGYKQSVSFEEGIKRYVRWVKELD